MEAASSLAGALAVESRHSSGPAQEMGTVPRLAHDPFFWVLTAALVLHTLVHYAAYSESLRPLLRDLPYFNLHALHEVEFLGVIAAAAYRYRWQGGVVALVATLLTSIPYVMTPVILGKEPREYEFRDRSLEVAVMLGMGVLLVYLLHLVAREKERAQHAWRERQATLNRLITLSAVSRTVPQSMDVKSTVSRILEAIASHVHGRAFFLYTYDAASKRMTLAARQLAGAEETSLVNTVVVDPSLERYMAQPVSMFGRGSLPSAMRFFGDVLAAWGMVTHAIVPLPFMDELLGMVVVSSDQRSIPREDVALLSSLGYIIGLAMHNARIWESAGPGSTGNQAPLTLMPVRVLANNF